MLNPYKGEENPSEEEDLNAVFHRNLDPCGFCRGWVRPRATNASTGVYAPASLTRTTPPFEASLLLKAVCD
jgi:hypothetical protein